MLQMTAGTTVLGIASLVGFADHNAIFGAAMTPALNSVSTE
jgi:hypothetical protein